MGRDKVDTSVMVSYVTVNGLSGAVQARRRLAGVLATDVCDVSKRALHQMSKSGLTITCRDTRAGCRQRARISTLD